MTSKKTPFKPILGFPSQTMTLLTRQVARQGLALQTARSVLHYDLASHVLHCIATPSKVTLYTDSSVWASQLRFYSDAVLRALDLLPAKLIVKVIAPLEVLPKIRRIEPHIPSQSVINDLNTVSAHINDNEISAALARLSATLNRAKTGK